MTKEQRAKLIRQHFKAKFTAFRYQPDPQLTREPERRFANERVRMGFYLGTSRPINPKEWLARPDPAPRVELRTKRRRKGESAITAMARKLLAKPKRWA